MELHDFQKCPSVIIRGQFGVRRIYSNKKGKFLILFEGMNNTLTVGGSGNDGKYVWMGKRPTEAPSTEYAEGLIDFARVFALALDGEYKVRKVWSNKKEKNYLIIENVDEKAEESYLLGSSGDDGKNMWMIKLADASKSSEATLEEVNM